MMKNVFEVNLSSEVEEIPLTYFERHYYQIDNFYKNPQAVLDYLDERCHYALFKPNQKGSLNGKAFADRRHTGMHTGMYDTSHIIKKVCKAQNFRNDPNQIFTNTFQMLDKDFNDYENNWWWPHLDHGWTALIYLNKEGCEGTNLYHRPGIPKMMAQDGMDHLVRAGTEANAEHVAPWVSKDKWNKIYTMESTFNRMVLFPSKIYHGQNITSDRWFNEVRMNQVVFFHY